jgi:hypothetical protein
MSTRFLTMPDAEQIAGDWLRGYGLACEDRVYSSLPAKKEFSLLTVKRIYGTPAVKQVLDSAVLDAQAWGNSKTEAHNLAQEARVALLEMEGQEIDGAIVTAVVDEPGQGIRYVEDPPTGKDRYVFAVRVFSHVATAPGS